MYHTATPEEDQTRIIKAFTSENSEIRVLIATVAFGLGINIPDIRIVVNWGLPSSIMQQWQEVLIFTEIT